MKSRIASALAVLACVGALAACSGKGSAAATPTTTTSSVPASTGSSAPGSTDSHGVTEDPDGDLTSLDQQLSDIDGALSSAEPTQTAGDNG
jgi:ABC-type glycerol-3-phosphate transport system substrate-binding protein